MHPKRPNTRKTADIKPKKGEKARETWCSACFSFPVVRLQDSRGMTVTDCHSCNSQFYSNSVRRFRLLKRGLGQSFRSEFDWLFQHGASLLSIYEER